MSEKFPTGLLDLPTELLLEIASKLSTSNLNRFIRTNRALHDLLFVELCKRDLKFFSWTWSCSAFHSYVIHGYELGVRTMLSTGVDVDRLPLHEPYYTALKYAVGWNQLGTTKILLDHGADPNFLDDVNYFPSAPFYTACQKSRDNITMIRLLLDYKDNINLAGRRGRTPLLGAIYARCAPNIKFLLRMSADIQIPEPEGGTPLHIASEKYVLKEILSILLEAGARVDCFDKENMSPLHIAAFYLLSDRISELLEYGAKINLQSPSGPNAGYTALHYAASAPEMDAREAMLCLIRHGSDVNAKDHKGRTPFLLVRQESPNTSMYSRAEILLHYGAYINARDDEGWSVLHHQADTMSIDLLAWLCARGCDVNCYIAAEINAPGYEEAGFVNLTTSDGIVHGQVRQSDLYSFVRIYESGHEVPFYQPLAAFSFFERGLSRKDIATGKKHMNRHGGYRTSEPLQVITGREMARSFSRTFRAIDRQLEDGRVELAEEQDEGTSGCGLDSRPHLVFYQD